MTNRWVSLGKPHPKGEPEVYTPFAWPDGCVRVFNDNPEPSFEASAISVAQEVFQVIERRRSRKTFAPLKGNDLSELLRRSARTLATAPSALGFELEQRPAPSAGAIHPIHVLLKLPDEVEWCRYDSRSHALIDCPGSGGLFEELSAEIETSLPSSSATKLLLVAEPGKTQAKYNDASSLVWRDAGALLGIMAVVAEALSLHYSPLGITGDPWVSRLGPDGVFAGVGVAVVGRPES